MARSSAARSSRTIDAHGDPAHVSPSSADSAQRLDQLIHERTRLAIVSALAASGTLSFVELRNILDTSDGNVSTHARKLEEGGYLRVHKRFEGRVPRTEYELTDDGRAALERYLDHMEALIRAVRRP